MSGGDALQTNAADPAQVRFAGGRTKARRARHRSLWRWLLSQQEGRELLYDVILADLGHLRYIGGPLETVYGEAALHNLCCRWMAEHILVHPELYLQMQGEALRRAERDRQEIQASRTRRATQTTT